MVAIVDQTSCEQILWAETKNLGAATDDLAGMLRSLRAYIAVLCVQTDGAPFPKKMAIEASLLADPLASRSSGAGECRELAKAALASPPDAVPAAILVVDKETLSRPATILPWDVKAADIAQLGPFQDGNREFVAFIKPNGSEVPSIRFWSSLTQTGVDAATAARSATRRVAVPHRVHHLAYGFLAAAALLFFLACGTAVTAGTITKATYLAVLQEASRPLPRDPQGNPLQDERSGWEKCGFKDGPDAKVADLKSAWQSDHICQEVWHRAQQAVLSQQVSTGNIQSFWAWLIQYVCLSEGHVSVKTPMMMTMVSLLFLCIASGLGVLGRPSGILIDNRCRMSLTRTQTTVWMIVLIGGWACLAFFNAGFPLGDVGDFFPKMDWPLWGVLGISLGTTSLSSLIVNQNLPATSSAVSDDTKPYVLTNDSPQEADLSDIVYGETSDSKNVIDASRVQHVGITAVLIASYTAVLLQSAGSVDGLTVMTALVSHAPVFPEMPRISESFFALLVVTHGTLLAGKVYDSRKT